MDEILKLQQMFMEVQSTSTLNKLADRNVVEIINLLKNEYGLKLHFSEDGSEFMTPEQLDIMIIDTIAEHGKVAVGDLHNYLLVQQHTIDSRITQVLNKSDSLLVDNVLLSKGHLDMLFEEINEKL